MYLLIYAAVALSSTFIRPCHSQTTTSSTLIQETSAIYTTSVTSSSMSTTISSATGAATHTVNVAKGSNAYDPSSITADIGDVIEFRFYPTNHTVIRAEYEYPCIPYEDTGSNKVGFFSGFHPVDTIEDNPPTWNLTVNSTEPVFFYCSAPNSCIGNGMVGVINPNSSQTLSVQTELAHNSSYMLLPGEAFPDEGSFTSSMTANLATATPTSTSASSTATPTQTAAALTTHTALSKGAIAGIAVAGAVVLFLLVALFYLLGRNKGLLSKMRNEPRYSSTPMTPSHPETPYTAHSGGYTYGPEMQQHYDQSRYDTHSPPPGAAPPYPYGGAGSPPNSPPPRFPSGFSGYNEQPPVQTSNLAPGGQQPGSLSPQELAATEVRSDKKDDPLPRS